MLTMLEEVVLLAVDENSGALRSTRPYGTAYALVGAVFFDLALARKIDTDTEQIHILDRSPTGSATLDRVLAAMSQRGDITSVREWIEEIFSRRDDLEGEALASLIRQGILKHEKSKRLWIIDVERFPMADNRPQRDVRLRLADAILSDSIPETRDIMLVSLAESCGLLSYVLSAEQIASRHERIELLSNLETISRKVASAIADLENTVRQGLPRMM
ncbi:MAG: GPP34 family phosphoprotein [Acidobacteriia bacterium]|nr:GPP34 family phosphoprotein [Terriglobia bacterium]